MSMTVQIIIAVSLAIIALYFLILTVLSLYVFVRFLAIQKYFNTTLKVRLEAVLDQVQKIAVQFEDLSTVTRRKLEDFTELIPETKLKLEEIIALLDLFQSHLRGPLLKVAAVIKVIGEKINRVA
jgi:hypothetical protein